MNLKSKLLGISAASVLALGMTSGVMAQNGGNDDDQRETVDVSVVLVDDGNGGMCSFTLDQTNVDFGELTWDGTGWTTPDDQTITMSVTADADDNDCSVSARSGGLFLQDDDNGDSDGNNGNNGEGEEMSAARNGRHGRHGHDHRHDDRIGVMIDGQELRWRPTIVYSGGSDEAVELAVGLNTSNPDLDAGLYSGEINFQLGRGR